MSGGFHVGDTIEWAKQTPMHTSDGNAYPYGPRKDGEGIILETYGRNILVDMMGSTDWLWKPDMAWIKRVKTDD
jgi:hypothetical protein